MTVDDVDEVLREFLLESSDALNTLDQDFVALERNPDDRTLIGEIFRLVHTIKGTCGFFAFERLERLTHAGEALLCKLRDGEIRNTSEITTSLLKMVDGIRCSLEAIETTGSEGVEDFDALIANLTRLSENEPIRAPAVAFEAVVGNQKNEIVRGDSSEKAEVRGPAVTDTAIRVDVEVLDRVMNLVGELVLARNQLLQFAGSIREPVFAATTQRLNALTTELQEGIMKTRMQPIGNVWNKFPRVIRDLAHACGKRVILEVDGAHTELDRTIIEAIRDPLTHAVRNAVDHGIEAPEIRKQSGKPEVGTLRLRAFHEGGHVNIEVTDDGRGLDIERIRVRAVERGLVAADRAARMGEREVSQFIFHPGFSTAATVTNVSGRGVGMDVVKTNIEKIGGSVDVTSLWGRGTTLRVKIPLTLAIIPALVVSSMGCSRRYSESEQGFHRFAIPQVNLMELVRLEGEVALRRIEDVRGVRMCRLRGSLLPLVSLNRSFALSRCSEFDADVVNIVVVQGQTRPFGIVVDKILDTEEIVVKPLGKELKGVKTFSGATIMGDGRVALILDVLGFEQHAGLASTSRDRSDDAGADVASGNASRTSESWVVFSVGDGATMAIPLAIVARLEEIAEGVIEQSGGRAVVQYRGGILPLIDLRKLDGKRASQAAPQLLQVIVYSEGGRSLGFIVEKILDIVPVDIAAIREVARPGVSDAVVIQGKVTELLNVRRVIQSFDATFFGVKNAA